MNFFEENFLHLSLYDKIGTKNVKFKKFLEGVCKKTSSFRNYLNKYDGRGEKA